MKALAGSLPSARFAEALSAVEGVEGWLTDVQAHTLWERARELESGAQIVEIGSYRGRSAIVMGLAAREDVRLVAIDPHAGNDRGPQQFEGSPEEGEADGRAFRANLDRAGLSSRVRHVRLPSQRALAQVEGEIDLLYVDGSHRYRPARADLDRWGGRVRVGGSMLVHDAFSSFGVTLAIGRVLLTTSRFSYEGRKGSLAEYRRRPLAGAERLLNFVRQLAELPWFLRNLLVKVLLLARLRGAARLLGHREGPWPY